MDHRQIERTVKGSPVAVLMVHGIAGTPAHFQDLIPVIPENWTLHNILLDGHGKGVRDFSNTSMKKWRSQVQLQVERLLATHERLIIIGHSMGTLFAIRAAVRHPKRIPFLMLLNVPIRPWVPLSTVRTCLRVCKGNLRQDDKAALDMLSDTCIRLEPELWKYIGWAPRLMELLEEIRQVRKLLPELTVPTYAFQSGIDELVHSRSCDDLTAHLHIKTTVLRSSGHFRYSETDTALLRETLRNLLKEIHTEY